MLSIITPIYNGIEFIASYRDAIKSQILEKNKYEIILIDNGSTDGSLNLLKASFENNKNVKVASYTKKQSSYATRNYGVSLSKGDVFAFTDIDCIPSNNWILKCIEQSSKYDGIISGNVKRRVKDTNNVYEYFDKTYFLDQQNKSNAQSGATANLVVSKQIFDLVGGFKEFISGADTYFCDMAVIKGSDFHYCPNLIVEHPCFDSFKEIKTKSKRIAFGIAEKHLDQKINIFSKIIYYLVGAILNREQFRKIGLALKKNSYSKTFFIRFSFISLFFGVYIRLSIVANLIKLFFKQKNE